LASLEGDESEGLEGDDHQWARLMHLRKISLTILGIGIYTMVSEVANQYTTLLGYYNGFHENDSSARYLLSIGPATETMAIFSVPIILLIATYRVCFRWNPTSPRRKKIQLVATIIILMPLILLGINTTYYAISDYNTLHTYHLI